LTRVASPLSAIQDRAIILPVIAALGFFEVLVGMFVLVWLANRYYRKHQSAAAAARDAGSPLPQLSSRKPVMFTG
jgi:hypothetical protein